MENKRPDKIIGFIRYKGKLVEEGYLDARKSAKVLVGTDKALRFFIHKINPSLQNVDFEIPIKIQKGSWEALIPENIGDLIALGITYSASKYAGSALAKMAENDFENIGLKTVFKNALKGMVWVIKLASHVKKLGVDSFRNTKFKENNSLIGVPDDEGNLLWVPKEYLDFYRDCPEELFEMLAEIVEDERELEVGLGDDEELKTRISTSEKYIFTKPVEEDEVLFPELVHGQKVKLNGHVTRGNESANSIGFKYKGHILTCYPINKSVKHYHSFLFTNCTIEGYIDRIDDEGNFIKRRPKINFISLSNIETNDDLFNNT